MRPIPGLRRLFRLAAGRSTAAADAAEELELHLALRTEELMSEGMDASAARAEALRRFGNVADIHRTVTAIDRAGERAVSRSEWLDSLLGDLRQAVRALRRSPGFAVGTALTLGLGIGLNTAIFSVFDAVLLRPLPFAEPDRLVRVWSNKTERGLRFFSVSAPDYEDWKRQSTSFDRLATFQRQQDFTLQGTGEPEKIQGARVSAGLFALLGVKPALGRSFSADEDGPGAADRPVILSRSLWQRRFGSDSTVIGRVLSLDGQPWTVVGVMPADFFVPGNPAELWMPMGTDPAAGDRGDRHLRVLGRLKAGVPVDAARRELSTIARRIETQFPASNSGWNITLLALTDAVVGEQFRPALTILLGAVALVLLIACVNVATMVLGRSTSRARELAVRSALGAGTRRLGRHLVAEGLVLGLAGGILGVFLTFALVQLLHAVAPPSLPRLDEVGVNARALALAALLSIACGIGFGLVPLPRVARLPLTQSLREGGRGVSGGRGRHRTQRALVLAEMTLAVLLLSGSGLLIRSLIRLQRVDLGFAAAHTLTIDLSLPPAQYPGLRPATFYADLLARIRTLPGVRVASAISAVPLAGNNSGLAFAIEGRPVPDPKNMPDADYRVVTPGYFRHLSIPMLRGRDFTEQDDSAGDRVALVSSTVATKYWPGEDPVGKRIRIGDVLSGPLVQVIGVVGDVRHLGPESEQRPMMYFPERRAGSGNMSLVVTTAGDPTALTPLIRREVHAMDPGLPLGAVRSFDDIVDAAFAQRRFNVVVLGAFALAALVLAGIGLYGVMAYSVAQRTHELGVRLALGAQRKAVVAMVLGESCRLAVGGVLLGVTGALLLNRLLSTLLFEIKPNDPTALTGASVVLLGIALLGSFVPARRAARVDPMTTLRQE
jgi:predicted permease